MVKKLHLIKWDGGMVSPLPSYGEMWRYALGKRGIFRKIVVLPIHLYSILCAAFGKKCAIETMGEHHGRDYAEHPNRSVPENIEDLRYARIHDIVVSETAPLGAYQYIGSGKWLSMVPETITTWTSGDIRKDKKIA